MKGCYVVVGRIEYYYLIMAEKLRNNKIMLDDICNRPRASEISEVDILRMCL